MTSRAAIAWTALTLLGCGTEGPAVLQPSDTAAGGGGASSVNAGGGGAAPFASAGAMAGLSGAVSVGGNGGLGGSGGIAGIAGAVGGAGGSGGGTPSLNDLAQALDGFRMDLPCHHYQDSPCEPQNSATPNRGYLCCYVDDTIERKNHSPVDTELTIDGDASTVYDVRLRVRGVVENRDYLDQGTKQGDWVRVGGSRPAPSAIHVFGVTVSDPQQTYFLNSWNDLTDPNRLVALDYEVTLPMRGAAHVRLFEYDDIGKIWANAGELKVESIPPYPQAPEGQFLQLNVVAVTPRP